VPSTPSRLLSVFALLVVLGAPSIARAGEEPIGWSAVEAGRYLDEREKVWFEHAKCVSCHTVLPYALARPALRGILGVDTPTEQETKLLSQIKRRVANWKKLDSEEFGLYYDDSDQKKRESWGTEAVFNAVILAFDDRYQRTRSPSAETRQAFANLWETQVRTGGDKGSWDWLDFNEAPWGNTEARYFGAALAAIAVETAPGYYAPGDDARTDASMTLLRGYLKDGLPKQNLHNRAWALWAATKVEGILTESERTNLVDQLLGAQRDDGGWSLTSIGTWTRNDGSAQETASDGYATALVLHVLQTAGLPKQNVKITKGLEWLKRNQTATGAWRSVSVVKKREPDSHTGKFMSDAATAFAVLALSQPMAPVHARTADTAADAIGIP
jgi:squalene-hopene/tetraprenyl-beta-curcumene cyclase